MRHSDEDYIRKAVELADGFSNTKEGFKRDFDDSGHDFLHFYFDYPEGEGEFKFGLDALAAQLVRQVDAFGAFHCEPYRAIVCDVDPETQAHSTIETVSGHNRTMNTIRTIVDSGVLEQ